jgi:hypothetical protein
MVLVTIRVLGYRSSSTRPVFRFAEDKHPSRQNVVGIGVWKPVCSVNSYVEPMLVSSHW